MMTNATERTIVRYVPNNLAFDGTRLDEIFQALADGTRLAIVERLSIGPASTMELSRPFSMALPSLLQHLGVLERVGIVSSQKTGRVRVYQLSRGSLARAAAWLETNRNHWERRLDQLDELLLADTSSTNNPSQASKSKNQTNKEQS